MGTVTSNRRALLAAAGAVVMGSGITAGAAASVADLVPGEPDAELIALGSEGRQIAAHYDGLLTEWWALESLESNDPQIESAAAEMQGPHDRICDLAERARDLRASTPEGWQAKAVLIRHLMNIEHNSNGEMQFETFDQELIWSLICDMTGGRA